MLYYKQVCASFDINQLPPSIISSYFPLLLHVFVLKQCTSFLSLLPNWQQEPSQGSPLHKPTLKRKEKTQQKQPLQTVNSKNVVWQHVRSICLLRKYSCHHPKTMLVSGESGLWMACPGALCRPSGSATAALIPGGFEILLLLLLLLLLFFSPLIFLILWISLILHCDLSHVGSFCGIHVDASCDSNVPMPGNIWVVFYSCDTSTSRWIFLDPFSFVIQELYLPMGSALLLFLDAPQILWLVRVLSYSLPADDVFLPSSVCFT